jgi:serine/threonine protein phosphatase PrpC
VDSLITEANRHGGLDNITAIIIRIDSVETPVSEAAQTTQPGGRPT